jgi:hypothetical protein
MKLLWREVETKNVTNVVDVLKMINKGSESHAWSHMR